MSKFANNNRINLCLLSEKKDELVLFMEKLKKVTPAFYPLNYTEELSEADMVVLQPQNEEWGYESIRSVRANPEQFLMPCLLISEKRFEHLAEIVDETLDWPAPQSIFIEKMTKLTKISARLDGLNEIHHSIGNIALRKILLLRYLYTRDPIVLKPKRHFQSKVGYTYPLVQTLFKVELGKEVELLQSLEEAQLLTSELVDKINVCPFCEHTQINFRELCPSCHSLKISEEATIHHFRCAYVGRELEFKQEFRLECPKCNRELRHIGVDYDKPAEVLWCNDCNHNFSEPRLSCFCLACGNSFSPEDAFVKQIGLLSLSQEGFRAAEEGVLPGYGLINILKKELGFYKREVFSEYLRIETFRCRRYGYHSTLARLNLKSANEAFGENSLKYSRKLKNDFAAILNQTFRTTDLFTDLSNGEVLIIFTNTDNKNVKIALQRLNDSLNSLLNTDHDLEYKLFDLAQDEKELEKIWEKMQ